MEIEAVNWRLCNPTTCCYWTWFCRARADWRSCKPCVGPDPPRPSLSSPRGEEADRVEGLRRGADDYVVKPFGVKELLARVEAVLRRSPARPRDVAEFAIPGGVVDLERHETRFADGQRAALADMELSLLRHLVLNSGRAISREEILASVWQIDSRRCSTRTIDMHIARLRQKLRDDPTGAANLADGARKRIYLPPPISSHMIDERAIRPHLQ